MTYNWYIIIIVIFLSKKNDYDLISTLEIQYLNKQDIEIHRLAKQ